MFTLMKTKYCLLILLCLSLEKDLTQRFWCWARRATREWKSILKYVIERSRSSNAEHLKKIKLNGAIAQLGERLPCTQEVCGSIPHSSTIYRSGEWWNPKPIITAVSRRQKLVFLVIKKEKVFSSFCLNHLENNFLVFTIRRSLTRWKVKLLKAKSFIRFCYFYNEIQIILTLLFLFKYKFSND